MGTKDKAAIKQAIQESWADIYGTSTPVDSDAKRQAVSGWLDARNQFQSPSQSLPSARDILFVLSFAKIVLLEGDQSDVSLLNLAISVLSHLNTYVLNNGLDEITSDPIEQNEIYAKLQALQGLERKPREPVEPYKVNVDSFPNTRNAINKAIEGIKNYFDPIPSIRHSMTTRVFHFFIWGALIIPFFPFVMPIGFLRGAYLSAQNESDNPYNHRAKVIAGSEKPNLATRIVVGFVNGLTAAIFEPLRFIVSFDQWSPENQRRFNRVENGLFNVLFFPTALLIGLVRAVRETLTNLGKMWRGEFRGQAATPLYGASVLKAFSSLTQLGAFLQFLLLPVDLGIGAIFNGLRVLGIIPPSRYEKFVYGVATAVWVGFLSVLVLAPAVAGLGGVIGAFFYGIIGKGSGAVALSTIKASVGWAPGMYAGIGAKLAASTLAFKEAFIIGIPKLVTAIANINFAAIGPAIKGFFVNSLAVRLGATFFGLGAIGYTISRARDNGATSSEEKRMELFDQAGSDANTARADQARAAVSLANASTLGASTTPTTTTSTTPSASTTATATTTSSTASPVIINPVTGTTPTAAATATKNSSATNPTTDPTAKGGSSKTKAEPGGGFTL